MRRLHLDEQVSPARIAAFRPDIRLLSILRNPIDRAFSHYLFLVRNGSHRGAARTVAERRPDLVSRGRDARHLSLSGALRARLDAVAVVRRLDGNAGGDTAGHLRSRRRRGRGLLLPEAACGSIERVLEVRQPTARAPTA